MTYNRNPLWKNLPDLSTPASADKLNNIEDGIESAHESIDELISLVGSIGSSGGPSGYTDTYSDTYVGGVNTPGVGGVTDHADLTGVTDVDSHPMSAITGLVSALSGKAESSHDHNEFAVSGHTHETLGSVGVPAWSSNLNYEAGVLVSYDNCVWRSNTAVSGKRKTVEIIDTYFEDLVGAGSISVDNTKLPELQPGDTIVGVVTYTGLQASPGWLHPVGTTLIGKQTKYYSGNVHTGAFAFMTQVVSFGTVPGGTISVNAQGTTTNAAMRVGWFHLRNAGASPVPIFRSDTASMVPSSYQVSLNSASFTSQPDNDRYPLIIGAVALGSINSTVVLEEDDRFFGTRYGTPNTGLRPIGSWGRIGDGSKRFISGFVANNRSLGGFLNAGTTIDVSTNTTIPLNEHVSIAIRFDAPDVASQPFFDYEKWDMIGGSVEVQTPITDWWEAFAPMRSPELVMTPNRRYRLSVPPDGYLHDATILQYNIAALSPGDVVRVELTEDFNDKLQFWVTGYTGRPVYNDGSTPQVDFPDGIGLNRTGDMSITYKAVPIKNISYQEPRTYLQPIEWSGKPLRVYNREIFLADGYGLTEVYSPPFTNPGDKLSGYYDVVAAYRQAVMDGHGYLPTECLTWTVVSAPLTIFHDYPISTYSLDNPYYPGVQYVAGVYSGVTVIGPTIAMGQEAVSASGRNGRGNIYQHEFGHHVDFQWMNGRSSVTYKGLSIPTNSQISSSPSFSALYNEVKGHPSLWDHVENSNQEYFAEFFALLCYIRVPGQTKNDITYVTKKSSLMPNGLEPRALWFADMVGLYNAIGCGFASYTNY